MNSLKASKAMKFLAISLAVIMTMLSLTSCSSGKRASSKLTSLEAKSATYSARNNHIVNKDALIYVAKSGLLELYFDSATYCIAIKDTSCDKTWYSLPVASDGDDSTPASVVNVRLSSEKEIYELNSQDNSVAFSAASFKPVSNGIQITYNMALDAETALKGADEVSENDVFASVSIVYSLSDGAFFAKINSGDIFVTDNYIIESVDLLNYFGASTVADTDDFIFVPDAGGALIMTGNGADDSFNERRYNVYGSDLALKKASSNSDSISSAPAIMPVFGMKSSQSAFLGIILSGDTIADIISHRKVYNEGGTYNRVGASFRITDASYVPSGKKLTRYAGSTYTGEINLCYRFLSGKNSSYVGLASACREMLIREGVLSNSTVDADDHIPLMLTIQGAASKNSAHSYKTLSTYEQTGDLLAQLKAKGVNSITMRYCGALGGADNQDALSKAKMNKSLGSKKEFNELKQYVSTQKFEMYLDLNIFSFNKSSASVSKTGAVDITGKSIESESKNKYSAVAGKDTKAQYFVSLPKFEGSILSFVNSTKNYPVDGYCINDAGKLLYSDYSDNGYNRSNSVNIITTELSVLSNNHKTMVENGNFYLLSNASTVVNLPTKTAYPEAASYKAIPFAEIVLHGIADYSNEPLNLSEDSTYALLKSIEYGAMPSYEWVCEKTDSDDFNSKYHYEEQLAQATDNYILSDSIIGNLRSARITAHYEIQNGVYCTEYNNSIVIYFNYNQEPVTVNAITINPMSCLRAN